MNSGGIGTPCDIGVWYRNGTSFGNETNPLGDWSLLGNYSGTANGQNFPTNIDLGGNGITFSGGTTYGLDIDNTNYPVSGTLWYTNGQFQYSNGDLRIDTNCGKGAGGFSSSTFSPRAWNGTVNDCTGAARPVLTVTNLVAGATATVTTANGTPGGLSWSCYSLTGAGPAVTGQKFQCGAITVDMSHPMGLLLKLYADASGTASGTVAVPAGTAGISVWMQALDVDSCTPTNGSAMVIG